MNGIEGLYGADNAGGVEGVNRKLILQIGCYGGDVWGRLHSIYWLILTIGMCRCSGCGFQTIQSRIGSGL